MEPKGKGGGNVAGGNGGGRGGPDGVEGKGVISCGSGGDGSDCLLYTSPSPRD